MSTAELHGNVSEDRPATEQSELLSRKISELSLVIPGTRLEALILQLYQELESADISFRPKTYLSDEWGCPQGVPVIGIPFYLADPKLAGLEGQLTDIEAENEAEVMMYLRHEAGHAFNYAYRLYIKPGWRRLFGRFSRPYKEKYQPHPFSVRFVHNIPGWYAQKHPDEDFAETFAVWMTPRAQWRKRYKGWGAMKKLLYMERIGKKFSNVEPFVAHGTADITVEQMYVTVADFYDKAAEQQLSPGDLTLDTDLMDIFNASRRRKKGVRPAIDFLRENRKTITDKVTYWTGVQRPLLKKLMEAIESRVAELKLNVDITGERQHLTELVAYMTALAMNYISRGKFVQP